jgi:hypothetical protein
LCRAWFGETETRLINVCEGGAELQFEYSPQDEFVFEIHIIQAESFKTDSWEHTLRESTETLKQLSESLSAVLEDNFNYNSQLNFEKDDHTLKSYPVYREKIETTELSVETDVPA